MAIPNLQMFRSDNPAIEVGTLESPIDFGICPAGSAHAPSYDLLLFNDRGGVLGSDDAKELVIGIEQMTNTQSFISDGSDYQVFNLALFPIVSADVLVDGIKWARVTSLSAYGPSAQVYTLNLTTGLLSFGDNIHGKAPLVDAVIDAAYSPDLNQYGKTIVSEGWISVQSTGVVSNTNTVTLELAEKLSNTQVQLAHFPEVIEVIGIWDNAEKSGTNYFVGGQVNTLTGICTLNTEFTSLIPYVEYRYTIKNDSEGDYFTLFSDSGHSLVNPIPVNNAKILKLKATIPALASTEGGVGLRVSLKISYTY